ncbi:MAG: VWA domain-containing protein [bacterium]|nr:VWA domain-containing protein [bacterium]
MAFQTRLTLVAATGYGMMDVPNHELEVSGRLPLPARAGFSVASPSMAASIPKNSNDSSSMADPFDATKLTIPTQSTHAMLSNIANPPENEEEAQWDTENPWFDSDAQAFFVSILFHVVLLLALAIVPSVAVPPSVSLTFEASPKVEEDQEFTLVQDVAFSDSEATEVGANSSSDMAQALSMAPVLADISEVPSPSFDLPQPNATFELNTTIEQAVGLMKSEAVVKGMTGVAATGTDGAVDRITYEILRSMEERPTLVVWLFDQSGSLLRRRQEIRDRFDRIYEELGIVQSSREQIDPQLQREQPLLTSVFAFGDRVQQLTSKPTGDIDEIRQAIDSITLDETGVERVFSALYKAAEACKRYRTPSTSTGPERNVMFIAVTDERGDDATGLEATIKICRRYAIPVYVIGVPSPFGREFTYVKYVDPDPEYDQTPQWAQVDQGPESIMPERVKLGYRDDFFREPVIDSGFGPYALSRLAYETGGIYFTVHPNRQLNRRVRRGEIEPFASGMEYFFDPEVMAKYQPDYVSNTEYMKRLRESPLRQILVQAASQPAADILQNPNLRFVKRDEASFVNSLSTAQREAARVQPQLEQLAQMLKQAEDLRNQEISLRWLASYELALGSVLAHKVRAEGYNAMLAKAKRGMSFEDAKNNTWVLEPGPEISVGSRLEKEGQEAFQLLERVAREHSGTPWGLLATRELERPIGWAWKEEFTDLNPPPSNAGGNNNNNTPRPPADDQPRMLEKQPPKRPIPKL